MEMTMDDEITTCDACGRSVYVEATATTEDGDDLCPDCADSLPDPIPRCDWCGDTVYPGDSQKHGMHQTG